VDGPVAYVCQDCHATIHRMFSRPELAASYRTITQLQRCRRLQMAIAYAVAEGETHAQL